MKYNTIEIEERRARNEALIAAAANEGNGNGMNMFMGMNLGQTLGGQLSQQVQIKHRLKMLEQATCKNFLYRSRWKIRPRHQRRRWQYRTSQLIKILLTWVMLSLWVQ